MRCACGTAAAHTGVGGRITAVADSFGLGDEPLAGVDPVRSIAERFLCPLGDGLHPFHEVVRTEPVEEIAQFLGHVPGAANQIVPETVTEYITFEYDVTAWHNVAAGEHVRWLPHRRASGLALPGKDLRLFDTELALAGVDPMR